MPMPQPKPVMPKPIQPFAHEAEREEECPLDAIFGRAQKSVEESLADLDVISKHIARKPPQPEHLKYDPKKHGPLLPEDDGPSLRM